MEVEVWGDLSLSRLEYCSWGRRLRTVERPSLPPQLLFLDFQKEELSSSPFFLPTPSPLARRPLSSPPFPFKCENPCSQAGAVGSLAPPAPTTSPLQPSLPPPIQFHSIDFCCMSTLIIGECEGNFFPSLGLLMISELVVY